MKTKKIYVIRHGETQFNKLGMVQGSSIDAELDELGTKQAQAFYEYYANEGFAHIYTSKLRRTYQTVKPFIDNKGIPTTALYGLNEISWGSREGKKISPTDDKRYFRMITAWKEGDYYWKIDGGESPLEIQKRQQFAWQYIINKENEDKILVCTHGRALRVLICTLLNLPLSKMDDFKHTNTSLYLFNYHTDTKHYDLILENDTLHLTELYRQQKLILPSMTAGIC